MGQLILCSHSIAAMPYYIDKVSLNVYSLEELCYYIQNNLYLIEADFVCEDLCIWIERELLDKELAQALRKVMYENGTLVEFVCLVLQSCCYCTQEEIEQIVTVLEELQGKSPFECGKARADRYMDNERYVKAAQEYQNLLSMEEECNQNSVLKGDIWHNLGTSYARLFLFDEAAVCYWTAYECSHKKESLASCMAACSFAKNHKFLKKYKEEQKMSDEEYSALAGQWSAVSHDVSMEEFCSQIDTLFADSQEKFTENKQLSEMLETWKTEYKKSCGV